MASGFWPLVSPFICELGLALHGKEGQEGKISSHDLLWNHLATWLLSLSNTNNYAIRLSLLSYFGSMSYTEMGKKFFQSYQCVALAYTVLDHLFFMLFNRKKRSNGVGIHTKQSALGAGRRLFYAKNSALYFATLHVS